MLKDIGFMDWSNGELVWGRGAPFKPHTIKPGSPGNPSKERDSERSEKKHRIGSSRAIFIALPGRQRARFQGQLVTSVLLRMGNKGNEEGCLFATGN
jgi:hypothetical protein